VTKCVFCNLLAGKLPSSVVYEDDAVCALLDIQPVNPGHTLVIPKTHFESLCEVPPDVLSRLIAAAQRVVEGFNNTDLACEGANLFLADGEAAGQEVPHVHLHVFPRVVGDGFGLRFGAGYKDLPTRETLDRVAASLRAAIAKG